MAISISRRSKTLKLKLIAPNKHKQQDQPSNNLFNSDSNEFTKSTSSWNLFLFKQNPFIMVSMPRFSGIIEHPAFKLVNKTTKLKIILCSSAEMRLSLWMKMILFYFCLFGLYVGFSREAVKIKSGRKGVKRWKIVERGVMRDFWELRKEMPGGFRPRRWWRH